jgi:hypothetical protein
MFHILKTNTTRTDVLLANVSKKNVPATNLMYLKQMKLELYYLRVTSGIRRNAAMTIPIKKTPPKTDVIGKMPKDKCYLVKCHSEKCHFKTIS